MNLPTLRVAVAGAVVAAVAVAVEVLDLKAAETLNRALTRIL